MMVIKIMMLMVIMVIMEIMEIMSILGIKMIMEMIGKMIMFNKLKVIMINGIIKMDKNKMINLIMFKRIFNVLMICGDHILCIYFLCIPVILILQHINNEIS